MPCPKASATLLTSGKRVVSRSAGVAPRRLAGRRTPQQEQGPPSAQPSQQYALSANMIGEVWSEPHLPDQGASQLLGLDGLELDGR